MNRPYVYCLTLPLALTAAGAFAAQPISVVQVDQPAPLVQLAQATVQVIAPTAPPPPRVEVIPPPPSPTTTVWEAGYWSWNGSDWTWVTGHYVERPSPQAVWEPGHWMKQANGWRWIDGRWNVAGG